MFLGLGWASCFGYLEERVYCVIEQDYIQVFLWKDDARKCSDYIYALDQSIKLAYKDMLVMQKYVLKGQDVVYWEALMEEKEAEVDVLQKTRAGILFHIQTFEHNIFEKVKELMLFYLEPHEQILETQLTSYQGFDLQQLSGTLITSAHQQVLDIQRKLDVISEIKHTQNLEEIIGYIGVYLSLKKELWKLD